MLDALLLSSSLRAWGLLLVLSVALTLVSRTWYNRWLLGGVLSKAGSYQVSLLQLIRTPGNVVHEGGHAIGFLLAGYRVTRISFWFLDKQGRGFCEAGRPWAPWASDFLARLIASPAPLFAGALVLRLGADLLQVPTRALLPLGLLPLRLGLEALSPWVVSLRPLARSLASQTSSEVAWRGLETVHQWLLSPWGWLQAVGFVFLLLALSLDLAPSWEDTRSCAPAVGLVTLGIGGAVLLAMQVPQLRPYWKSVEPWLTQGIGWISEPLSTALLILVAVGILLTPLRVVFR